MPRCLSCDPHLRGRGMSWTGTDLEACEGGGTCATISSQHSRGLNRVGTGISPSLCIYIYIHIICILYIYMYICIYVYTYMYT